MNVDLLSLITVSFVLLSPSGWLVVVVVGLWGWWGCGDASRWRWCWCRFSRDGSLLPRCEWSEGVFALPPQTDSSLSTFSLSSLCPLLPPPSHHHFVPPCSLSANVSDSFYYVVWYHQATFTQVRRNIKVLTEKHNQAIAATSEQESKELSRDIDRITDETTKTISDISGRLKNMDKENKKFVKANGPTAETRIRNNMQGTLTQKFKELVQEFQEAQQSYKDKYRERIERQIKIVKPNYSQKDVDSAMTGDAQQIFADQILASTSHAIAINALADVQERHQDIIKLEKSINQLHQLFVDLSVLVESQGEMLDHIEESVKNSENYTRKGAEALTTAVTRQKRSRKKLFILGGCVLVILLIVIVVFTSVIRPALHL